MSAENLNRAILDEGSSGRDLRLPEMVKTTDETLHPATRQSETHEGVALRPTMIWNALWLEHWTKNLGDEEYRPRTHGGEMRDGVD